MSARLGSSACAFYSNTPLKHGAALYADSEFTGPPMLAAFFVTATISIAAVLFSYFSGALEVTSQNFVDARLLRNLQDFWYSMHPRRRERQMSLASTTSLKKTRSFRKEGITQFILALSDQQLVTGAAILLAALANLSGFNRYEIIMIDSLAWFSATTHLATLDTLSHYLESHRIVRAARIAMIVVFLALFSCAFVIRAINAMVGNEMFSPALFALNQTSPHISDYSNWHGPFNIAWQSSWTIALLLVLFGYLVRIQALLCNQRHPFYMLGWLAWLVKGSGSKYKSYGQIYTENKAALRYQRILWVSGSNGQKRWMPFGYDDSFLSSIPGILFSFSYGISQLVAVRWGMRLDFIAQDHPWGFGQIVALLLLCLPFMAAGATISDYKQKQNDQFMDGLRELETSQSSKATSNLNLAAASESNQSRQHVMLRQHLQYQELEAIETTYAEKLSRVKQYFCREVSWIAQAEAVTKDRLHVARSKQSMLNGFAVVEQCEKRVSIVPHMLWFGIQACAALILGALLNAASFDAAGKDDQHGIWLSISVLLVFVSVKVVTLTYEITRIMRFSA